MEKKGWGKRIGRRGNQKQCKDTEGFIKTPKLKDSYLMPLISLRQKTELNIYMLPQRELCGIFCLIYI